MKEKRLVKVGLVQTGVSGDVSANLDMTLRMTGGAADAGARIICLQELCITPYFPREENADGSRFAETIPGKTTDAFSRLAREKEVVVIVPVYEKTASGTLFNTAAVIDADGSILGTYRKIHIPFDEHFYEKKYFAPGDTGFQVFKTAYANISVLICYDQWYPEAARIVTLMGADIIFYPTAIGYIGGRDEPEPEGDWKNAWETIQRSHAIANGVHVCAVNRVGKESELEFWGGSFACDAFGNVLARAGADEEILIANLDLKMNNYVREGWGFIRNRRPEVYGMLTKRDTES